MNNFILNFFGCLNRKDIGYCHFKSNNNLYEAASGVDDLDLLVERADVIKFQAVLSEFGFLVAHDRGKSNPPFVYHFFSTDPDTGLLVHLHVYYKMVTGGSIFKNNWLPVERMFLQNTQLESASNIKIPIYEADYILFVLRKAIEQPSPVEYFLFVRDHANIKNEIQFLERHIDNNVVKELLAEWIPEVSIDDFMRAEKIVRTTMPSLQRFGLGWKVRSCFRWQVKNLLIVEIARIVEFVGAFLRNKLGVRRTRRFSFPGGRLIAFVGSEASGKSTISLETFKWISERFDAYHLHLGKPKKSPGTLPLWFCIRLYSRGKCLTPWRRGVSRSAAKVAIAHNLPHPIVSWLDSVDRLAAMRKAVKLKLEGCVVITDRYPSNVLDGPRIVPRSFVTRILSYLERRNYLQMPQADMIFRIKAPLALTLERNGARANPEPEDFVRARFRLAEQLEFKNRDQIVIDSSRSLDICKREVRNLLWWGDKQPMTSTRSSSDLL